MLEQLPAASDFYDCSKAKYVAFGAGAAASVIGVDRMIPAAPAISWVLIGAGAQAYCEGGMPSFDQQLAWCMAAGYGGGFLVAALRGSGMLPGPLL